MNRSLILNLFGIASLILGVALPEDAIKHHGNLFIYAIIFFTGAIITSAIEDKK